MKDIRSHYNDLLKMHGDTYEAAQYSSKESQEARFKVLTGVADLDGAKILDFGCGTGHFATYLKQQGISVSYTGVDIVDEFFVYAKGKHPEHRFGSWEDVCEETFDYVFVSGVFNNRIEDNWFFFSATIQKLFAIAGKGVAFNLMSSHVDYYDDGLWYVEPEKVFGFIKGLTPYVSIRNDYVVKETIVPFEFAVYAYKLANRP